MKKVKFTSNMGRGVMLSSLLSCIQGDPKSKPLQYHHKSFRRVPIRL